jgi:hypothetical protein
MTCKHPTKALSVKEAIASCLKCGHELKRITKEETQ